jgi:tripartite-type tricarboxylate transporter receptor subunit TctC
MKPALKLACAIASSLCTTVFAASAGASTVSPQAASADYPAKPITLVVPFPPGGLADLVARPLATRLGAALKQTVIVENRGGASGTIGTAHVASSAPDGYTLLFATANEIAVCPVLYHNLPYDTYQSFTPIAQVVDFPAVLVTPQSNQEGFADLVKRARAKPGTLAFASSGAGSTNHLTAEVFSKSERLNIINVHYKGGGPAMADVAGGHVDAMFATLPSALPLIRAGKLRALATTGATRSSVLPEVPTLLDLGIKQGDVTVWAGVLGPAGLPVEITQRLNAEIKKIVTDPGFQAFLRQNGAEPLYSTTAQFGKNIRAYRDFWEPIIKTAGISLNQ